jgi:hypothetical protein
MNVAWAPPIPITDLEQLSFMLRESPSIVAALDDFSTGNWEELFRENVVHGTDFFAHLDANFLSHLLRLFSPASLTEHACRAAAMMCLAITFDMKVNPTFATHEYAFTGLDAPDPRLAGFYYINNLHPQQLANVALGRRGSRLPALDQLRPTKHEGTHRQHLRMHGLTYASLLKIVELHRCDAKLSTRNDLSTRAQRAEALLDWMYHDFLFCGAPLFVADQLWGQHRQKAVLKGIDACEASNVLTICRNAAWDLVLAENWAENEGKRRPGDPFHLIFTFDAVLRTLASQLLAKPHQLTQPWCDVVLEKYRCSWPGEIAKSLADRYLEYEGTLDLPTRRWNTEN